ncbi:hypothetical protein SAMN05444920_1123 [Nonomuraea solani]|uniref:Uncharacterized protein n=1 Tax=Nonomuraea solani TaxID=1144553 RepID=A0A1H6EPR3_9ACTN|nr:hypothetical protein [Nonomuraea solani]SEG98684.1 hypothetical protein SAMN05444920_1123 [Nonomuraea solani]
MAFTRLAALLVATSISGTVLTVSPVSADPGPDSAHRSDHRSDHRFNQRFDHRFDQRFDQRLDNRPGQRHDERSDRLAGVREPAGHEPRRADRPRDGRKARDRDAMGPRRDNQRDRVQTKSTCAYRVTAAIEILEQPRRAAMLVGRLKERARTLGACRPTQNKQWTKVLAPRERRIGFAQTKDLKNLGPAKYLSL